MGERLPYHARDSLPARGSAASNAAPSLQLDWAARTVRLHMETPKGGSLLPEYAGSPHPMALTPTSNELRADRMKPFRYGNGPTLWSSGRWSFPVG